MYDNDTLAEEANNVAEYAELGTGWWLEVKDAEKPAHARVERYHYNPETLERFGLIESFLVDRAYFHGNMKRLPDDCTVEQMVRACALSHPEVMGISDALPRRAQP